MPQPNVVKLQTPVRIDQRIEELLELEDLIAKHEAKHKKFMAQFINLKEMLKGDIQYTLEATGQLSAKTDKGTARIHDSTTAACSDPDAFMAYVTTNGAYWLMDRKANKIGCEEFLSEHGRLPPGVKFNTKRSLIVTKATAS